MSHPSTGPTTGPRSSARAHESRAGVAPAVATCRSSSTCRRIRSNARRSNPICIAGGQLTNCGHLYRRRPSRASSFGIPPESEERNFFPRHRDGDALLRRQQVDASEQSDASVGGVFRFVQSASRRERYITHPCFDWGAPVRDEHTSMATDDRSQPSCSFCGEPFRVTGRRDGLTFYACVRCTASGVKSDPPQHEFLYHIEKLATGERESWRERVREAFAGVTRQFGLSRVRT
jgi:hypothetical protein